MEQIAKHILFAGRVQGVGFRFCSHRIANRCELNGYVRNTPNGKVEMHVQGHPDDIADCLRDIEQTFANYISDIQIEDVPIDGSYDGFDIKF